MFKKRERKKMDFRVRWIISFMVIILFGWSGWGISQENPDNSFLMETPRTLKRLLTFRDKFYDATVINDNIYIVGYYGTILHLNLKEKPPLLERQKCPTTRPLFAVSFGDECNGLIVGSKGLILRTEDGGSNWQVLRRYTDNHLFSVHFVDPMRAWAVGEFGTIIYTADGGKTWQDRSLKDEDINLNKCFFIDANMGWIVGEFSTILYTHDGGLTWHFKQKDETGISFYDILFKNRQKGIIAGQNGTLYQTLDGGDTWRQIKFPKDDNLLGINILDGRFCIVGLRGTIIEETNDGTFQANQSISVPDWLHNIIVFPSGLSLIFGDHGRILYSLKGENRNWAILN